MTGLCGEAALLERLAAAVSVARAAGADDAEASYEGRVLGMTRFAGSYFTQAGVVVERRTRLRAAVGPRIGCATTGSLAPEALAQAAARAAEIARVLATLPVPNAAAMGPARFAHGGPRSAAGARWDEETATAGPRERVELAERLFVRAAADRLLCAGALVTGPYERAVVTSAGTARYERGTRALLEVVALDGRASGYAVFHGPTLAALDADALADEACRSGTRARDVAAVDPGPMDVVLGPAAVAEALEWMAGTSFTGRALLDGTSLLTGRQGQRLCAEAVTVMDDAGYAHPCALPQAFDAEGTAKQAVTFIDRGIGGRVATDLATARRLGDERGATGHAAAIGDDMADGPTPLNLVMAPGDASVGELIGRVARGLFVTRFHYVNGYIDTRRAGMTGMTRDGTFLIEDGRMGRAVPSLRWTESLLEALGRLGGIGRELACVPMRWTGGPGSVLCPALLIRQWGFNRA